MSNDIEAKLAELKTLHDKGFLSAETYETAVNSILAEKFSSARTEGNGATAVGAGGVNARDVSGFVITGSGNTVYNGPKIDDPAEALRIYCRLLARSTTNLPLRGVDVGASDPAGGQPALGLAQVYIDLDTTTRIEERSSEKGYRQDTRPLLALEAAVQNRRLVLTGDPGGGKSTFITHLAHCLAANTAYPDKGWPKALPLWPAGETNAIPLLVILRDFAHQLPDPLPDSANPAHLADFIQNQLEQQQLGFVWDALETELEAGRAVLLFDGLDEVTTTAQRAFVRDALIAFTGRYHQRNRVLVTCRILSYQPPATPDRPDLRLPQREYPIFELAPFDEEKIDRFIAAWYAELARLGSVPAQDSDSLAGKLQSAVRRPDLWRLAGNPLLLTVMALVHAHKGRLPDARALLYEDVIEMLLWRWEAMKTAGGEDAPALRRLLLESGRSDIDLKKVLWRLAYAAHAEEGGAGDSEHLAGISEGKLTRALAELSPGGDDWGWAHQVVRAMKLRAGLLLERSPGVFTFPHRTFQEYLAGAHLSVMRNFGVEATKLAGEGAQWREVVLLSVGRLVYLMGDTTDKPLSLVNRLCPPEIEDGDTAWRNAWLAGDVLREMGLTAVRQDSWGRQLWERVRGRLAALVAGGKLAPRERVEAGDTLAALGDPRPGVCTLEPDLVDIPAGTFLMGEEKHEITLDAFAVARYPVTNAQYRFFIEDGGYTDKWRDCWTAEGWQDKQRENWTQPRLWDLEQVNQANQPVVAISWYEALAYCRWLAQKTGRAYRLPTEAEWERAARHTDGRLYPWGDEWREKAANYKELGLRRPAAVGAFPAGMTECGARDMSGNVWEWCSTRWHDEQGKEYPQPYRPDDGREDLNGDWTTYRVFRGGSFRDGENTNLCSARDWYNPLSDFYLNRGVRVVVSPFPPLDPDPSDL